MFFRSLPTKGVIMVRKFLFVFVVGLALGLMGYSVWLLRDLAEMNNKLLSVQKDQSEFLTSWSEVVESQPGTITLRVCVSGLHEEDDPVCTMPRFARDYSSIEAK